MFAQPLLDLFGYSKQSRTPHFVSGLQESYQNRYNGTTNLIQHQLRFVTALLATVKSCSTSGAERPLRARILILGKYNEQEQKLVERGFDREKKGNLMYGAKQSCALRRTDFKCTFHSSDNIRSTTTHPRDHFRIRRRVSTVQYGAD